MFLMFRLHRPDVLPVGDLGIVKAVQKAYGLRKMPIAERLNGIGEAWRPYRSVACWYLWSKSDNALERSIRRPLSIALLVVAGLALATAQPSTQARRPSDIPQLTFEKITLPNGLEVILSQKRGLPMVAVNLWYHVGPGQRGAGPHRLRAPLRAHDVPELEARARGLALQAARGRRRQRHQRHDRLRPHQLLRDRAVESARARAVARVGPHGLPAREGRPGGARRTSRTSCATSGVRASRTSRTGWPTKRVDADSCFPKGHPYYGNVIGSHEDIQAAKLDDVQRVLPPVLRAEQRHARHRRRLRRRRRRRRWSTKYFGTLKRGPAVPPITVDDADDHRRAAPGRARRAWSCRASTWRG